MGKQSGSTNTPQNQTAPTIAEIDAMNETFWNHQTALTQERIGNPVIYANALLIMRSEEQRAVALRNRTSLGQALADVENMLKNFKTGVSKSGGMAPKTDPLSKLIQKVVRSNPSITEPMLLHLLHDEVGGEVIESIDDPRTLLEGDKPMIRFFIAKGVVKMAPVSGLRDRLARSKKNNCALAS